MSAAGTLLHRVRAAVVPGTLGGRVLAVLLAGAVAIAATVAVGAGWLVARQQLLAEAYAFGVQMREILAVAEERLLRGQRPDASGLGVPVHWSPGDRPLGFVYGRPPQHLPRPPTVYEPLWPSDIRLHLEEGSLSQDARQRLTRTITFTDYLATLSRETARLGVPAQVELTLSDGGHLLVSHPDLWRARWRPAAVVLGFAVVLVVVTAGFAAQARRLAQPFADLAAAIARSGDGIDGPPLVPEGPVEAQTLARSTMALRRRVAETLAERGRMLAAISHDLRTPSTRLRLRAEYVSDPEAREAILNDLDEMDTLLADTLDLLSEAPRREPERMVDFESLVQSICDDYADFGRPVTFRGPPPLVFHRVHSVFDGEAAEGDPVAFGGRRRIRVACRPASLRRALTNLIDNALKYGRRARVDLDADAQAVTVAVHDDGPGIPEEHWEAVFLPFHRLDRSRSRGTGGSGLGLAIVRSVADIHQGHVELENIKSGGFTVRFTIPRKTFSL